MNSKNQHRFKDNPMERRFHEAWQRQNHNCNITGYVLSDDPNHRCAVDEDTDCAISTMMQWLGSPVGQAFLEDVLDLDVPLRDQLRDKTGL